VQANPDRETLHATAVSFGPGALLLLGPSGAGKSGLALQLMACGARLIADDRVLVFLRDGQPLAAAPETIRGRIEARGVGIMAVPAAPPAPIRLAVDLGQVETDRLPPRRETTVLGQKVRLLLRVDNASFPATLALLMQGGRIE